MHVADVMTHDVECIYQDASVAEAAQRMRLLDVGLLPVWDGERLVGVVTDRDITVRATAEGHDPAQMKVREIMTPRIVACFDDEEVATAAKFMGEKQLRRLLVTDQDGTLAGIVSLGDLASELPDKELVGDVLKDISQPLADRARGPARQAQFHSAN